MISYHNIPDATGHFGPYGGRFIPETLIPVAMEIEQEYLKAREDQNFWAEFRSLLKDYVGRPSPLYEAKRLGSLMGENRRVWLKREDLNHTGAHKINNTVGQVLLANRMGKKRIIAETGAGQHGVATATVCALYGLTCIVYMGEEDIERQAPNVYRMKLLGATVVPVSSGSKTLKDATNEAIRDWVTNPDDTFYIIGSVVGMHPFPMIVRDFQSVIGKETLSQSFEQFGSLPDYVLACVGGGSNAMGIFHPMIPYTDRVKLIGVEAAGHGLNTDAHAATLTKGIPGVIHGAMTYLLQNEDGQVQIAHSISAGLDYPGVGPEHAYLKDRGLVTYVSATDQQALDAVVQLSRREGIIPALESAHALAWMLDNPSAFKPDSNIVVNLSGRGDKDLGTYMRELKL
ncbi:MAG: tryptophan synthase subunit beta [Bacteroidetes bacterium]|nr:tryptophan synthase subunit beta [Bacteroidota bacterium]